MSKICSAVRGFGDLARRVLPDIISLNDTYTHKQNMTLFESCYGI